MRYLVTFCICILFVLIEKSVAGHDRDSSNSVTIGIDLGTTYSVAAVLKNGHVEIVPNDQGNKITPSYVTFTPDGERLIGDAAKTQLASNPQNTLFDIKRFIGREWSDPVVQKYIKLYPFKVTEQNNRPAFEVNTNRGPRTFIAEEISAMVLLKMKESAEVYLGTKVQNAVITVPAYFNDAQRQATRDAGEIAGLNVTRIINEPTAAALAYGHGLDLTSGEEKTILVFDLGGGTFDVSLLSITAEGFFVIATNGNTTLGGEDFDQRVVNHLLKVFKEQSGVDVRKNHKALQKLRREAERVKRSLSTYETARIEIESLVPGIDFVSTLTRYQFEQLNVDLFKATLDPIWKVLKDSDLTVDDVDEILLVGGSTRIPKIRQELERIFKKKPNFDVNADEAVAHGAAIQVGILVHDAKYKESILVDVNPLTLGIEVSTKGMSPLITKNTVIPVKKSSKYTTVSDNQESVLIQVYEGERVMAADNHLLGEFTLDGIPPAPKGDPSIEVTFVIDANGILQVTADATESGGKKTARTITNKHNRLTPEQIAKMTKDADKFASEDKLKQEILNARNELESLIYNLGATIRSKDADGMRDLLHDSEVIQLEEAIAEGIEWLNENPMATKMEFKGQLMKIETLVDRIVGRINATTGRRFVVNSTQHHDEL